MNRLNELVKILNSIKETCENIKQKSEQVKKELLIENLSENDYVIALSDKTKISPEKCFSELETTFKILISDSENALLELDDFITAILDKTDLQNSGCKFLLEIWNGESYKEEGIDALRKFNKELIEEEKEIDSVKIFKRTYKDIKDD